MSEQGAPPPYRRLVIDARIVIELPDDRNSADYVRAAHNYLMDQPSAAVAAWPVGRDVLIKVAQCSFNEYADGSSSEPENIQAEVARMARDAAAVVQPPAEPPVRQRFESQSEPPAEMAQGSLL